MIINLLFILLELIFFYVIPFLFIFDFPKKCFNTISVKISIPLFLIATLLIFFPFFPFSINNREVYNNISIGLGTNIYGLIITIMFIQRILDKHNLEKDIREEKEKIIRLNSLVQISITDYITSFQELTTPISKTQSLNLNFSFEDIQDLYYSSLLITKLQKSKIVVFYENEKKLENDLLRMLSEINFFHYPKIRDIIISFIKEIKMNDVCEGIIANKKITAGNKTLGDLAIEMIKDNKNQNWITKFDNNQLRGNIIVPYVVLYKSLHKQISLIIDYQNLIKQISDY